MSAKQSLINGFTRLLKDDVTPSDFVGSQSKYKEFRDYLSFFTLPSRRKITTPSYSTGFTMLEMMVVMAIVLGITAIVIAYIPQFRDRSNLDLLAQEVAINIRGAQVYASGGRVGNFINNEIPSYGVHFDLSNRGQFFIFENRGEPVFDPEEGDVRIESDTFNLRGIEVVRLALSEGGPIENNATLDLVYTRPRLEAKICLTRSGAPVCDIQELGIVIQAVRSGNLKGIRVRANGQIGVYNVE
ncbi:MAG: prepilin-type N-terminal cleavage/methylation domain-containing protein [Patescibacteria group bacterium]